MHHTRIKICGLTRSADITAAVSAGADALGFVFYAKSPRYLTSTQAAQLLSAVPPFVSTVGLFVNASPHEVSETIAQAPVSLLQFHGDETPQQCAAAAALAKRPYLAVVRMRPGLLSEDLLKYEKSHQDAGDLFAGLLLDAYVDGFGGGGKVFNWSLIPEELAPRVILSGGLRVQNAADAVRTVRPYAVDVSSGVEGEANGQRRPGIKDAACMHAFTAAVRAADAALAAA